MKSILIIGLGRFGSHIARKLNDMGHEVMAVDNNEERINNALDYVTSAQIGDSTNRAFLESLDVGSFDSCIVAIGDNFQNSLETAWLLKELGARKVIARASSGVQEKFLLRNGADQVVYPEKQLAAWTAIRCSSDTILDYIEVEGDYSIYELSMPQHWVGKTVAQIDIRRKHGINILGVRSKGKLDLNVMPDTLLSPGASIRYRPIGHPEDKDGTELVGKTPLQIKQSGVSLAFVPEDRLGMGLVGTMGMTGNMLLRSYRKGHGIFTDRKAPKKLAEEVLTELDVVTPSVNFPVRRLSGGNVQKVLVGREIAAAPTVLLTAYAVRGLDINASYTIYDLINKQKQAGVAVVFVGEDLDVLLELCDRILVLCGGKVSGIVEKPDASRKPEVGMMMTRLGGKNNE